MSSGEVQFFRRVNGIQTRLRRCDSVSFMAPAILITRRNCSMGSIESRRPQRRTRGICTMVHEQTVIQSVKNQRVKDARALLRRRQREKENRILLEGRRLIMDALEAGVRAHELFFTPEALERTEETERLRKGMVERGARDFLVSDQVIRSFSDTVNPQGLVGIFERPNSALPQQPHLTLICDNIHDPGNLGSLLRSAAGAGVNAVCLSTGCADVWGLKALRAGMGAQFRLPIQTGMKWEQIEAYVRRADARVRVAEGGGVEYTAVHWGGISALVVGSEAEGVSMEAREMADEMVGIGLGGGVESLNAAMAGAVILFEAKRQRELVAKDK